MKKTCSVCLAIVMFIGWAGVAFSQQKPMQPCVWKKMLETDSPKPKVKVHWRVWQKLREEGSVKVIVELDMPWQWENKLSKSEIAAQRKASAEVQKRLLAELAGTNHKIRKLSKISPTISLEVDAFAVEILKNSPLVRHVGASMSGGVLLSSSVPVVGVGHP